MTPITGVPMRIVRLPPVGHIGYFGDPLEAFCHNGKWRMVIHSDGFSHDGHYTAGFVYYPGKSGEANTIAVSKDTLGKKTAHMSIKC